MMAIADTATVLFSLVGMVFFLAGTVGLLRFPDLFSRLHALTKADNLGLGLIVAGLLFQASSWATAGKLILIWMLTLWAGSSACYLIGNYRMEESTRQHGSGGPEA